MGLQALRAATSSGSVGAVSRYGAWLDALDWSTTGRPSDAAMWVARALLAPWTRVAFQPTMEGLEHIPRDRPFLLVANHSAGIGLAELASFAALWTRHTAREVPLAGFAHPAGFRTALGRWVHRHAGSAPSTHAAARAALASGVSLLVFPGGDHECLRPLWRAREVDFAGRTGFLRIARDAGVPIVPMGIRGSHHTAPLAGRSRMLANALVAPRLLYGTKRWGLTALGLLGALGLAQTAWPLGARVLSIWLWLGSPLVYLPVLPARIRFRIGAPLEPAAIFGADRDAALPDALARVQGAVQALVDAG